jgi:FtsH-binding integral membrane protein
VFVRYKLGSAAQVFAITSVAFAGLSLWGYTTKRDLSRFGTFLIMGLIGLILASLLNLWLQSGALQFVISCVGVLVFAGLIAYDTQRIKDEYLMIAGDTVEVAKAAVWGALSLFLDFVNLFQFLLSLLGSRE